MKKDSCDVKRATEALVPLDFDQTDDPTAGLSKKKAALYKSLQGCREFLLGLRVRGRVEKRAVLKAVDGIETLLTSRSKALRVKQVKNQRQLAEALGRAG